ncbi:InlB B-repeat-containing protein [Christensenellaceae bacterium OttesenSCG-928-K19]|nr:InlB B-repeat-containing protein [Christensenellaceae bacterium OttesenSCG-928-K19]
MPYYDLDYDPNADGVTSLPPKARVAQGTSYAIPNTTPVREGYKFLRWKRANGAEYQPGESFTMPSENTLLTAQWQEKATPQVSLTSLPFDSGTVGQFPYPLSIGFVITGVAAEQQEPQGNIQIGTLSKTIPVSNGNITIPPFSATDLNKLAVGTYDITVTTPETENNKATSTKLGELKVNPVPAVNSVTITPGTASVEKGNTQQFTATVDAVNGAGTDVTWSVSGNTSQGTTITGGLLRVGADETAQTLTVTATSVFNSTEKGTATVTVPQPAANGVTVSPGTATVEKTKTQAFTATVDAVNGADDSVSWSVDGTDSSISANGVLTVGAGETAKTLTVTATSSFDKSKTGTAIVTVADVDHSIIGGGNSEVKPGEDYSVTFAGEFKNLKALRLNGVAFGIVPQSATLANLTYPGYDGIAGIAEESSVKVTLYKEFLATLPGGVYTLEAEFDDSGIVNVGSTQFTLLKDAATTTSSTTSPKTDDSANMGLWIALCMVAAACVIGGIAYNRRKQSQK